MSDEAPPPENSVPGGPPPDEAVAAEEASAADETDAGWAAPGTPPRTPDVAPDPDATSEVPPPFPPPSPSPSPSGAWTSDPPPSTWTPPPTPPPTPPAATATGWTAPSQAPPRPKRRKLWPWMLGLVLIATIGSGAVGGTVFVTRMLPVVIDVDDFMSEVQLSSTSAAPDRHAAAAYNHLCAAVRNAFTLEDVKSSILASDEFTNISSYRVNPFPDVNGNTATIDVEITYNDGTTKAYSLDVVKENGDWQVCSNLFG